MLNLLVVIAKILTLFPIPQGQNIGNNELQTNSSGTGRGIFGIIVFLVEIMCTGMRQQIEVLQDETKKEDTAATQTQKEDDSAADEDRAPGYSFPNHTGHRSFGLLHII